MTKWSKEMDARELAKTLPDLIDRDGSSIETAELDAEDIHGICAALTTQADEIDRLRGEYAMLKTIANQETGYFTRIEERLRERLADADKLLREALVLMRLSDAQSFGGKLHKRIEEYLGPQTQEIP